MRFFLVCFVAISIVVALLALRGLMPITTEPTISPAPSLSTSPSPPSESLDIDENGVIYRVAWLLVHDPSAITLIPNFDQKRTARSLIDSKECTEVVNGGFYTKDNQPTGLFVTQGTTIRGSIPNTLLNGYLVVDQDNNASILASPPDHPARLTLQTGPILIRDGASVKLAIRDDEFARRVVVGITDKGTVVFLAIYDPDNPWSGPKLADTPYILSKVQVRLQFTDALNLDGGSASVFIRGDLSLEELTSVGSFFCIK
ncbi:phosphodiester glycosidase family protein [Candidatus Gottesmanbacteria bacterium]|nr:phosphodiester glycosidase family protein [Candidatus Gottesmanbacteria bacterium]